MLPLTMGIDVGTLAFHWVRERFRKLSRKNRDGFIDDFVGQKKDVTVVISAHGDGECIEELVRPIFEQTCPPKNVYVCDSNIDNTREVIEKLSEEFPNLYYWFKKGITAKSEKINLLARDPNVDLGELVYLKDSSAKLAPDVIGRLVDGFTEENMAAVTSFGYVLPPEDYSAMFFHYGKEWVNRMGRFRKTAQQYRRAMFVVCGASFMVKSDVLKKVEIPIGTKTEDTAYTWGLQEEGYKVGVVQDAVVHAKDVTPLKSQLKQSYRWYMGTWQNGYLHAKKLFGPRSKSKALGYSTILPGFIECLLYTGTIVSLPVITYFEPDITKYFLIGDTTLTLAAPFIATALEGNPKDGPKEFLKTLRHYHQITAYKLMSSPLWLYSGLKVAYDVLTGKSKEWGGRWEVLPERQSRRGSIKVHRLSKRYLRRKFPQFLYLEREWINLDELRWRKENFFLPKPKKWRLSSYARIEDIPVGYTIVSQTGEKEAFLHKIVVNSAYWGLGIGSRLFEDMARRCRNEGIERIVFKVLTDNERAISLYKKNGVLFAGPEICQDNKERYNCELKL